MAVKIVYRPSVNVPWKLQGLSTDTKPTDVPNGSTFYELDGEQIISKYDSDLGWVVIS